jgi:geranylgeranyl diphosphate synthase type II
MDSTTRIERTLAAAMHRAEAPCCPPGLLQAMRHAVFPRGSRIRPRLCLAVAAACGEDAPAVGDAAAAAIELMHCASLVHDDLPCFDDAAMRRGRPSVHAAYGQPLAVLAGDALIVLAFQALASGTAAAPARLAPLVSILAGAVGVPRGIVAGQAWECETAADLAQYQQQKTGALFAAATEAGAASAGAAPGPWRLLGERLGEAYQVADDVRDAACEAAEIGKPVGRDLALGRPSAALRFGIDGAIDRLRELAQGAIEAVPACKGAAALRAHILSETQRLLPRELAARAA